MAKHTLTPLLVNDGRKLPRITNAGEDWMVYWLVALFSVSENGALLRGDVW